ncbi:MAG: RdgB/HAM1 family non-canonical purine NTP pyrophosphatase, partial [Candidatus Bathyarchaeia archaeon]
VQSDSLEEIARLAATDAAKRSKGPVITEDAGLFIEALSGFPGPYSSYTCRTIGPEGIIRLMKGYRDRRAYFRSAVVYAEPDGRTATFVGKLNGRVTFEAAGVHGFGFDPIFIPDENHRTLAEMSIDEKNQISHRAKALQTFASWYFSRRRRDFKRKLNPKKRGEAIFP